MTAWLRQRFRVPALAVYHEKGIGEAKLTHAVLSRWYGGPLADSIDPTRCIVFPHRGHDGALGYRIDSLAV